MPYSTLLRYGSLFGVLAVVTMAAQYAPEIFSLFHHASEPELLIIFFMIAVLFGLSFTIFYLAERTVLPSFVVAIFFGIAAKPLLEPVIQSHGVLSALVGCGATLILFGGGLETPFESFRKLFVKILSLSFIGLGVTAVLFSLAIYGITSAFEMSLPMPVILLLGSILASTDPAAIIPVLKHLRFRNTSIKDLIISESAVTDVTGTLLTVVLLAAIGSGVVFETIGEGYAFLFSQTSLTLLLKQLLFGAFFGLLGYALLELLLGFKTRHIQEYEADSAFFLFIPIVVFTVALTLGGSGYLAAFVAGLLFRANERLHETQRFFNHMIDGFFKPVIFLLLGALVNLQELFAYAGVGFLAAFVFMFVIRPIAVAISLGIFTKVGKHRLTWRELLFISFIRETGAIPAVLLVTVVGSGIPSLEGLVPIGMWVILLTLIIEPPLTAFVARHLEVASNMKDEERISFDPTLSQIILATRGYSWIERLPKVVEWVSQHRAEHIVVLICLEDKYEPIFSHSIELLVKEKAEEINRLRAEHGEKTVSVEPISRKGLLEENIREIAEKHPEVMAIFVGKKMLDFRLREIQNLHLPIYFMD